MGVSVAAIAPRLSVGPFRSICVKYVKCCSYFGTSITFFRELCYLTVVTFKRQGNYYFQTKGPLTNFQTLTHQISLLAGLRTFNNPFRQKTKKEVILQH